jgi:hypothetical protein
MKDLEESLLGRRKGLRIVKISLAIGLVGVLPLLLYIAVGPEDGNPIGLGLLAVLAVPTATIGVLIGLIKLVVEALAQRR